MANKYLVHNLYKGGNWVSGVLSEAPIYPDKMIFKAVIALEARKWTCECSGSHNWDIKHTARNVLMRIS